MGRDTRVLLTDTIIFLFGAADFDTLCSKQAQLAAVDARAPGHLALEGRWPDRT